MPRRIDVPLGGMRRKVDRQREDRARGDRKRKLDRVAKAFEQRARSRNRVDRTWLGTLTSGRAPFPRR